MAETILGTRVYRDEDGSLVPLEGKKITVLGYGSQGHAHALNLASHGLDVTVGLRAGSKGAQQARQDGLSVKETAEAVKDADVVMMLIPDELQADVFAKDVAPNLKPGAFLGFGHGFNIHFKKIVPDASINVFMVAPKGPGRLVRKTFTEGGGVPCLIAVDQDPSGHTKDVALAWAIGIGGGRSGILETTFKQETETDLFGEQAVLCGGAVALIEAGYGVLREAGYDPVNAYFECLHEMKLIVDLLYEGGLSKMRDSISNTAEYGDYVTGPRIITEETKNAMRAVLKDIQEGRFADEFLRDSRAGAPYLLSQREAMKDKEIEQVGALLRARMAWIPKE